MAKQTKPNNYKISAKQMGINRGKQPILFDFLNGLELDLDKLEEVDLDKFNN